MFVGEPSFDERRQSLSPPLSHSRVWVLADLADTLMQIRSCNDRCDTDVMLFPSSNHSGRVIIIKIGIPCDNVIMEVQIHMERPG